MFGEIDGLQRLGFYGSPFGISFRFKRHTLDWYPGVRWRPRYYLRMPPILHYSSPMEPIRYDLELIQKPDGKLEWEE